MNGFHMQCESARESWKDGQKVNVPYIADQDYQKIAIAVDHFSKSEDIYWMLNPPLIVYDTENGGTLQELPEKLLISRKESRNYYLKLRERKVKNTKKQMSYY